MGHATGVATATPPLTAAAASDGQRIQTATATLAHAAQYHGDVTRVVVVLWPCLG